MTFLNYKNQFDSFRIILTHSAYYLPNNRMTLLLCIVRKYSCVGQDVTLTIIVYELRNVTRFGFCVWISFDMETTMGSNNENWYLFVA